MRYLYSHGGSGNHGCEAIVRASIGMLGNDVVLYSARPEEDQRYGIHSVVTSIEYDKDHTIKKYSLPWIISRVETKLTGSIDKTIYYHKQAMIDAVMPGDIVFSIGGDNYCYPGTDILAAQNRLFRRKRAKTVLWGCSIDPEVLTTEMVKDLEQYDLITVREPLTQAALAAAGVTANVRSVADPAFLLDVQKTKLPEGFLPGNTIGLNLSPLILHYTEKKEEALSGFYALVQHILDSTDSTIALIPHVVKAKSSDFDVLKPLFERFENTGRVILVPDQNCMQLKYIISQCRLFIGARTHATIAAYSTFVPTLVIGYSVKSRGIATDLFGAEEHYVLPVQNIRSSDDLIHEFQWLREHETEIRQHLMNIMPDYQKKALKAKEYIEELIK